jgi:hypothetical protein
MHPVSSFSKLQFGTADRIAFVRIAGHQNTSSRFRFPGTPVLAAADTAQGGIAGQSADDRQLTAMQKLHAHFAARP